MKEQKLAIKLQGVTLHIDVKPTKFPLEQQGLALIVGYEAEENHCVENASMSQYGKPTWRGLVDGE